VNYDDETLMAYADGELDEIQRATIAAAIAQDPALARRVEQHRALRGDVSAAYAKVVEAPVPESLVRAARAGVVPSARGKVLQFPARNARAVGPPWRAREWTAMAASVLLGVFISWRAFTPADPGVMVAGKNALIAHGLLASALDHQLASEQRGEEPVLIGLTFKAHDGNYCRSFVLRATRTAGLACRVGGEWQIPATESAGLTSGDVKQASSLSPAILRLIEARMAGEALDADEEQRARVAGWSSGQAETQP
jgi:hypothetical protein